MTVDELLFRLKNEPEWLILGGLAVLLLVGGMVFYYQNTSEANTQAQQRFNSAFSSYQQASRIGNYEPAIQRLNQVISKHPDSQVTDKALFFLGKSYMEQGDYLKAMRQFQKIRNDYPNSFFYNASLLNLSYCATQRENHEQALTFLDELLAEVDEGPIWQEATWQKAMVLVNLDRKEKALASLNTLIEGVKDEDSFWKERAKQLKVSLAS